MAHLSCQLRETSSGPLQYYDIPVHFSSHPRLRSRLLLHDSISFWGSGCISRSWTEEHYTAPAYLSFNAAACSSAARSTFVPKVTSLQHERPCCSSTCWEFHVGGVRVSSTTVYSTLDLFSNERRVTVSIYAIRQRAFIVQRTYSSCLLSGRS